MRYANLCQYFQNEESLTQLIIDCMEYFDIIDEVNEKLFKNELNEKTVNECRESKRKVAGAKGNLEAVYREAVRFKTNEELKAYMNIKNLIKKGEKFIDGAAKQEASASVSRYREIRNTIEGYIAKADIVLRTITDTLFDIKWDVEHGQHE